MHLFSSMPFSFAFVLSDSVSNAVGHLHVKKEHVKRTYCL